MLRCFGGAKHTRIDDPQTSEPELCRGTSGDEQVPPPVGGLFPTNDDELLEDVERVAGGCLLAALRAAR